MSLYNTLSALQCPLSQTCRRIHPASRRIKLPDDETAADLLEIETLDIGGNDYGNDEDGYDSDDDDSSLIDYTNQRAVIIGRELASRWEHNFLGDLSEKDIDDILKPCTPVQQRTPRYVATRAQNGILPILGCAGAGKTKVSLRFIQSAYMQKHPVLVVSTTNAAVNNICRRAAQETDNEYLHVRIYPPGLERAEILGFDRDVGRSSQSTSESMKKRVSTFCWEDQSLFEYYKL